MQSLIGLIRWLQIFENSKNCRGGGGDVTLSVGRGSIYCLFTLNKVTSNSRNLIYISCVFICLLRLLSAVYQIDKREN